MPFVSLYFKVHQPYRLKQYKPTDVTINHCYEDAVADQKMISRVADECYLPANEIIHNLILLNKGKFKISYSISGVTLELLERYRPDVLASFKKLTATGCVELLGETYYHSLSSLHSRKEFLRQVEKHANLIQEIFNQQPVVFRNTELVHNNDLAKVISSMGFKGVLCEGVEKVLQGRSINKIYASPENGDFGLLLRNAALSDDIAFRFADETWSEHPLTADRFAAWIHSHPEGTEAINLFMDYETLGIHKKENTGIFSFLKELPQAVHANNKFSFGTPSDVLEQYYPMDIYHAPSTISWEDKNSDNCVWSENMMQNNMLRKIYAIENLVHASGCEKMKDIWGRLQAADYFYYMRENEGKYCNPFNSAKEAFQNYTNIITDFELMLINNQISKFKKYSSASIAGLF
jgi:alpha-amylase